MATCRGHGGPEVPQAAIQALDMALKHTASLDPRCQVSIRSIFWHDPAKIRSLGGGAEVRLPICLPGLTEDMYFCTARMQHTTY